MWLPQKSLKNKQTPIKTTDLKGFVNYMVLRKGNKTNIVFLVPPSKQLGGIKINNLL